MSAANRFAPCLLVASFLTGVFAGCSRQPPVAELPPLEVVVAKANGETDDGKPEVNEVEPWDEFTGTVEAKDSIEVKSRVRGQILRAPIREGGEITEKEFEKGEKGDLDLFIIDDGPFQAAKLAAQGELKNWKSKLELAEQQIKIYEPLEKLKTVSREDVLKVFAQKGEALGGIATSEAKIMDAELNIGYCRIRAPMAGKVGEALLSVGDMVASSGPESILTTIVAVDPVYVNFNVPEGKYQFYRDTVRNDPAFKKRVKEYQELIKEKGDDYRKKLEARGAEYDELIKARPELENLDRPTIPVKLYVVGRKNPYKGFVDFVDNRVTPGTSSIKVRARFDNKERELTIGLFARVRVSIAPKRPAILVADRAILTDQSLKYVLVVDDKGKVDRKDIKVSDRLEEDGRREVLDKTLTGDEWIVVEGVNRVRPGVTAAPKKDKRMPRLPV